MSSCSSFPGPMASVFAKSVAGTLSRSIQRRASLLSSSEGFTNPKRLFSPPEFQDRFAYLLPEKGSVQRSSALSAVSLTSTEYDNEKEAGNYFDGSRAPASDGTAFRSNFKVQANTTPSPQRMAINPGLELSQNSPSKRYEQESKDGIPGNSNAVGDSLLLKQAGPVRRAVQKQASPAVEAISLQGIVVRISFQNPENGYTVAKVRPIGSSSPMPIPRGENAGGRKEILVRSRHNGKKMALKAPPPREGVVAVVGVLGGLREGQSMLFHGHWKESKWGIEFAAARSEEIMPILKEDMERYLAGGVIKGVGPKTAALMVSKYGDEILKVLDDPEAEKLISKVVGIGPKKAANIVSEWNERRWEREAMVFLIDNGASMAAAQRLVKRHGVNSEREMKADPWTASAGLLGWGFESTDDFAQRIGADPNIPSRRIGGLRHCLESFCSSEGHTYLPWAALARLTRKQLACSGCCEEPSMAELEESMFELEGMGRVVMERGVETEEACESREAMTQLATDGLSGSRESELGDMEKERSRSRDLPARRGRIDPQTRCYDAYLYAAECRISDDIRRRASRKIEYRDLQRVENWIKEAEKKTDVLLSEEQRKAVIAAAYASIFVLTGGPGCGKTHTTRTIVKLWKAMGKTVDLCAPTGRAAQRLGEAAGVGAKTIHRLLRYLPNEAAAIEKEKQSGIMNLNRTPFMRNANNPLEVDAVIVDETSMLDVPLAAALLSAVPSEAQLLFVGDVDQLPPVGPGQVLRDIIRTNVVDVYRLSEIFRQAQESAIVTCAHSINRGEFPAIVRVQGGYNSKKALQGKDDEPKWWERLQADCVWLEVPDNEPVMHAVKEAVSVGIPALGLDPRREVQVLSAIHRGGLGTGAFNKMLQSLLNPPNKDKKEISRKGVIYRMGDRVIQLRNDYDNEIYNGDFGVIVDIDSVDKRVLVEFNMVVGSESSRRVSIPLVDMDDLALAWAITVHKSQGSEYPVVILPMSASYSRILSRKLLYTAITRAQRLAIVVGPRRVIQEAITLVKDDARFTRLTERIADHGVS